MGPETVFDAIEFAVKAHRGHYRKGTRIPYIVHPLNVATTLIRCGCPVEVVIAGILHDTVEDTDVTLEDIRLPFGERVAEIVEAVSEPDKSASWEIRKRHTLKALETAPEEVLLITLADKLDNLRSTRAAYARDGEGIWSRFNRPKESQAWYYRGVLEVLSRRLAGRRAWSLTLALREEVERTFGLEGGDEDDLARNLDR